MRAMTRSMHRRPGESGQALVIMVAIMLLSMGLLAVIIDGGNVLTQQRVAQTGADSTAEAGAIVLASRLAGVPEPAGGWDALVASKVAESAAANRITVNAAYYTDICGIPLRVDGSAALKGDGTENLSAAAQVGRGSLPGGTATTPDCPSLSVGPVAGVLVVGNLDVKAYVARSIGIPSFTVSTNATSVSGYLQGFCAASEGVWCAVLPVTIPVNTVTCDGQGNLVPGDTYWPWNTVVTVPLCKSSPGNVGWLDWTPPGGGANELVCEIINPNNPAVRLPSWQYVTSTGNVNGGNTCVDNETGIVYDGVEQAVRKYDGTQVLIPQFDMNCRTSNSQPDPDSEPPAINTAPNFGCPNLPGGGTGQNLWYRMPSFAFFQLCDPSIPECGGRYGAYMSGSNAAQCNTGNGATSCLVGKFVDILASGTVGAGVGAGTGNKAIGVQLIR
jgi:Flp pilus assembly protein TadG